MRQNAGRRSTAYRRGQRRDDVGDVDPAARADSAEAGFVDAAVAAGWLEVCGDVDMGAVERLAVRKAARGD